jgi:hypothetical protein
MTLKRLVGMGAIAGTLGFSAIGLAGAANASPTPQAAPSVVQHAQLVHWGGGGRGPGFGGRGFGGPGFGGRGFGGPGFGGPIGWGAPPPPCLIGLCI